MTTDRAGPVAPVLKRLGVKALDERLEAIGSGQKP